MKKQPLHTTSATRVRAFALAHLALLLPLASLAGDHYTEGNYTYYLDDNNNAVVSYYSDKSVSTALDIPDTLGGYSVIAIGNNAFASCTNLPAVTIPNGVRNIGRNAFGLCSSLTTVTIPNTVTNIGEYAFTLCSSLTNTPLPEGVAAIGRCAFARCLSLSSVHIPASVAFIDEWAFVSCYALTSITVAGNNQHYASSDGVLFNKGLTTLVMCPSGYPGAYAIPDSVNTIADSAFTSCTSLTSVAIHNGVTSIGASVFEHCDSLTSIGVAGGNPNYSSKDGVLFNKNRTTLIQYPNGLHGAYAIPAGVTAIGDDAFRLSIFLTAVTIPASVTAIGEGAFSECPLLTSVLFKGNVPTDVGNDVFYDTPDATVYYLPGATGWGDTFCGRPTALWNAAFNTTAPPQTDASGAFAFSLTGNEGIPVCIEACDDLTTQNWIILTNTTMSSGGTFDFTDPDAATLPTRFYRFNFPQ